MGRAVDKSHDCCQLDIPDVYKRQVMSKRGSPYLRKAIFQAALIASFKDPVLSDYYQKKRSEGKHHLTCVGAVARKMCNIIYAVLKNNEPYVPKA